MVAIRLPYVLRIGDRGTKANLIIFCTVNDVGSFGNMLKGAIGSKMDVEARSRMPALESTVLFSYGFRPFFLLSGIFAALAIAIWIPEFYGDITVRTAFSPIAWHAHEMLYGYLSAAMVGFLLTAVPNWTGRLPVRGLSLAALAGLWLLGRIAISASDLTGWLLAMVVDCSFLFVVLVVIAREIVAGKNLKNLKVAVLVSVVLVGNIVFHMEARNHGPIENGMRIGIAGMMLLVMVIGGRIIPSFTQNWLARQPAGRMPVAFNRFDVVIIAVSAIALLGWIILPDNITIGEVLVAAGVLHFLRLARWAGDRTWSDRLVFILHIAYLFVPIGFLLLAASILFGIPQSAAIHAWTIGAMATLTLAVMTRATLGHTGRSLQANFGTHVVYAAIVAAAITRVSAALFSTQTDVLLRLSALVWIVAFVTFVLVYGPMLVRPKVSAK